MIASEAIPSDWTRHLRGGRLGIGYDVATTEKKTSNPSSITVTESQGGKFWQRLVVRFKTADPEAAMVALETILTSAPARSLESLCVDASNERYHAQNVKRRMRKHCPVHLIVSGETIVWQGEKFSYKTLLGQLYVSAFEDQKMSLPGGEWLIKDHRLVKNHAGGFVTDLDDEGNHGDTFDSGKLALWSHLRGGKHDARGISAMQVGGSGGKSVRDDRLVTLARRQLRFGVPGEAPNSLSS